MERSSGAAPPRHLGGPGQTAPQLRVHVEVDGAATTVALAGELDLSTVPRLQSCLQGQRSAAVIIDLSRLTFIDSSGISALIRSFRESVNGHQLLTVVAAGSQVERVLQLTGVDKALPLFGDRASALAVLAESSSRPPRG